MTTQTVCMPITKDCYGYTQPPIRVGDKIGLSRNTKSAMANAFKSREMVCRLLKKKFLPKFMVTSMFIGSDSYSFNIRPYNF